ncbi:sulfurtransferase TusA family protein [Cognatishimia sp. WU-CL00825]|uniref:sulfurtransferase TusA family protein n=1 Tax=Cognatishimia sp. WU-CL00825 TaxID=3127658 RepID=UPI00310BF17D
MTDFEMDIDAIGLLCPLPVLKLRKRLQKLAAGAQVRLLTDDPASIVDVPHFCQEQGHRLLSSGERDGHFFFIVQRA